MSQWTQTGALYQPRGVGWEGDGKEVQEGEGICIPMADSCWGVTENNYPSIKNKLIFLKKNTETNLD